MNDLRFVSGMESGRVTGGALGETEPIDWGL
jgi:hypothetical protein